LAEERPLYVARESDLAALTSRWESAKAGQAVAVRIQAPFGGGRRALATQFASKIQGDDAVIWRVTCLDQENGLQWLVRMYGALVASLTQDILKRGRVEMVLNSQLPTQPKRVQGWYQQFIASLKEAKTDREKGQVQLRLPQDNPLTGLVEVAIGIARRVPLYLELQAPYGVNSLGLAMFLEALVVEARHNNAKLFITLFDEVDEEVCKALHPLPLLDVYQRRTEEITAIKIEPWGAAEVSKYLESKELPTKNAARIAEIASGRPGFIAELAEILEEQGKIGGDLSGITLAGLVPLEVDEGELDLPTEAPKEGERTHAGPKEALQVAYFGALLGQAFPAAIVADMGGYDRDSVDDLIDAMPALYAEVQYAQDLGTWLYRFKRGCWREGILEKHANDEGRDLARRVGLFMERVLVPRGYGFIVKTGRVYAENGAGNRASMMRALALTNDSPDIWGLCYDFSKYFDEIPWSDALRRTVFMNLLERLIGNGTIQAAEQVHNEVTAWAGEKNDRELTAWLLFNGSRLDARRQDLYRARDAIKLYEALENKQRVAEIHNHIAAIELQDGNQQAALDAVNLAIEAGKQTQQDGSIVLAPGIAAMAEVIRGRVAQAQGKHAEAVEHFRRGNEIAGQTNQGGLALDAGLGYGESLLQSGQVPQATEALERVVQIARNLRNPSRERAASELLAQAFGAQRKFPEALPHALRALEISNALKMDHVLAVDNYNAGFFQFVNNKPSEALALFKQSEARLASVQGGHPLQKELFYFKGLAHLQLNQLDEGRKSLREAVKLLNTARDWRKLVSALDNLSSVESRSGNLDAAKKLLTDAIAVAKANDLKEERRALRKKLDQIEGVTTPDEQA
jgi:tetratricopeptide (TPR) repeat protein